MSITQYMDSLNLLEDERIAVADVQGNGAYLLHNTEMKILYLSLRLSRERVDSILQFAREINKTAKKNGPFFSFLAMRGDVWERVGGAQIVGGDWKRLFG